MNNFTVNFTSEVSTNSANFPTLTSLDICVYFINIFLGFPTHSYVIWLIIIGTKSGVASEFINLSLSVCEIGICLNSLLSVIIYYTRFFNLTQLALFFLGLTVTGRAVFQCLICVERYLAVVHPVTFLKYKPLRYRLICCSAAWIITLGSCLCCVFHTDQFYPYIYAYFSSVQFLVFLFIQLFCLVAVLRALKQSGPGERKREKEENHMKRRAFFIILITTVAMSIIYMPCIISASAFILAKSFIVDLYSFGFLCFILGGFVQPLLYLHRSGKLSLLWSLLNIHFI